jgi:hypothetical protein
MKMVVHLRFSLRSSGLRQELVSRGYGEGADMVWKVTDTHFEGMSDVLTNAGTNADGLSVHVLVLKVSPEDDERWGEGGSV